MAHRQSSTVTGKVNLEEPSVCVEMGFGVSDGDHLPG